MNKIIETSNWVGQKLEQRELASPAYYFNIQAIIDDIDLVRATLGGEVLQDVSACPLQELLSRMPVPGRFGAITASRAELNMVAGWETDHAYAHLPGMTQQLTRAVLGVGHRLIAESPTQIETLVKVRGQRKVQPIMLSVHPSVVASMTGGHVGMIRDALDRAISIAGEHGIPIEGLSLAHSSSFDTGLAVEALQGMRALAAEISVTTGHPILRLIMGEWPDVLHTAQATAPYRDEVMAGPKGECIQHIGGASIFQRGGVLVTRVVDVQPGTDGNRAVCDSIVRSDFRANPKMSAPRNLSRSEMGQGRTTLVGTGSGADDVLGCTELLIEVGDFIAFDGMGAYFRGFDPVVALEGKRLPALLFFDKETDDA